MKVLRLLFFFLGLYFVKRIFSYFLHMNLKLLLFIFDGAGSLLPGTGSLHGLQ